MKGFLAGLLGGATALALSFAAAQTFPLLQTANSWTFPQTFNGSLMSAGSFAAMGGSAVNITASTTHSLAGANTAPLAQVSQITSVNASDAVALPACSGNNIGIVMYVSTTGVANTPAIWPQAADSIDAGGAGASTTLTALHLGAIFMCNKANHWTSSLFGAVAS